MSYSGCLTAIWREAQKNMDYSMSRAGNRAARVSCRSVPPIIEDAVVR
jgi:hypothetical protein